MMKSDLFMLITLSRIDIGLKPLVNLFNPLI